ncbi:glycosyltransferase [Paracoccus bogoriensis]|uniref:glycosyltransferase n=1 Tax=Paracoccus bogoriensis TaxID=242065 RepID=UPI001CA4FE47|nr:glycosyltransferase [Paracoccus bogoriensis]MBW7055214.1 glycosyltransferase [Paracoccus bogoriensis]
MHIAILLASYQGGAHIGQQLQSIAAQGWRDWSLIVSDDGSHDDTLAVVADFAAGQPPGRVRVIQGPRQGPTANFLTALAHAPDGAAIAFCDQDDLWFPDKLARAAEAMAGDTGPVHYAARTIIADETLRPICGSRRFPRPLGLRNAVVQAVMAGNTSVFSAEAARILRAAAPHALAEGVVSHDWWAYQVMAAQGARLIHDPRPALLYRQHPRSTVGRNDTLPALRNRLARLMRGEFGQWMAANLRALAPLEPCLPPQARETLARCRAIQSLPGARAARALLGAGLYRQTRAGTAALVMSAAAGRLRTGAEG